MRLSLTIAVALSFASFAPAHADNQHFDGYWRGTHVERGAGSGPFVAIVNMTVSPLPPRTIRDTGVNFTVALRVELSSGYGPRVKLAPPQRPQYPLPDRRPAVVPDPPPTIELTAPATQIDDPDGRFLRITVQPHRDPTVRAASACGFTISVTLHGGPAGDAVYYQIIPQRSLCTDGPFAGIASSRGYLAR